jgi:phosphohistidine swiveling domain-containing protein
LKKEAIRLSDKYGWIPFGYDGPKYWDKIYFINLLKRKVKIFSKNDLKKILLIKKSERENELREKYIIKKYRLNKQQINLIKKVKQLAVWTDERKMLEYQLHFYYAKILLEIGRKFNVPYKNLKFLFTEELKKIDKHKVWATKESNARIKNSFMLSYTNGRGKMLSDREKNKILAEVKKQLDFSKIKGFVASTGPRTKYRGKAKIILSPKEWKKVKKGDFLIATMTSPNYILAMKRATGFITDEGGVTCHAAIVAREMNKPCIIGTKNATKVLRDGDLIEVDVDKGTVKIIK